MLLLLLDADMAIKMNNYFYCMGCCSGVVRGVPGLFLPSWVLRVVHLLVAVFLGTSLALVGLYGSRFSSSVVLMWLVSALSAFLTSALLLEPFVVSYKPILSCSLDKKKTERCKFLCYHVSVDLYSGIISGCCGETGGPRGGGPFGSGDRSQKNRRGSRG